MLAVMIATSAVGWTDARADEPPTFAIDLRSADKVADKITMALEDALREIGATKRASYRAKGSRKDRVADVALHDLPRRVSRQLLGVDLDAARHLECRQTLADGARSAPRGASTPRLSARRWFRTCRG